MNAEPIPVNAVWLRGVGNELEVLVEIDGQWHLLITEGRTGPISHICENAGIRRAPIDPWQDAELPGKANT